MIAPSDAGPAQSAEAVGLPADLVELARLKANATGTNLEDYVRALVAADAGSFVSKTAARKAARG